MQIAVIGSGIAGLTCAHVLSPHHQVTLFEADDRIGGHSNTVLVDDPEVGQIGVDTGFIVHNDRHYPNLQRLFDELGVATIDTEMSFGVADTASGLQYRATNLSTLLADRRNLIRPDFWKMVVQIPRFYRRARQFLEHGDPGVSVGQFLRDGGYSPAFINLHLVPMGASVWSSAPNDFLNFPAQSLFRFLDNHGLLSVGNRPQWKAIPGGSRVYVNKILDSFSGTVRMSEPVISVTRDDRGVVIQTTPSKPERFDAVVLACHSDQALNMLADPTLQEKDILSAIRYQPNRATLHTDTSVMPGARRAWAAWNYHRMSPSAEQAVLTYDLTLLQGLPSSRRYMVTLNADDSIDPKSILASFDYAHPVFDGPAVAAQSRVTEISGVNRTHFAGAYWSYGFHEDGMASGLRVCTELGHRW